MRIREKSDRSRAGFTAFDLLLIIVILAVGIAYFWPSYTYCGRSKLSRVKSDMRSVATAVESYYIDNNVYPAWSRDPERSAYSLVFKPQNRPRRQPSFLMRGPHHPDLQTITTPISYITNHFTDPFGMSAGAPFSYYSLKGESEENPPGWIMWSPGPDQNYDLSIDNIFVLYDPSELVPSDALVHLTYDPTNGTVSAGDVWRVKQ